MMTFRSVVLFLMAAFFPAAAMAQMTRDVTVSSRTVVTIEAQVRFTTMIVLPEGEEITEQEARLDRLAGAG